jgi:hypothetical protein
VDVGRGGRCGRGIGRVRGDLAIVVVLRVALGME